METPICVVRNLFRFEGFKPFVFECDKQVVIGLKSRRKCGICPSCGKRCRNVESEYERIVRDLDLVGYNCFLQFSQKKINCRCGYRGLEKLDFVSKSRRVTKRMELFVLDLCERMSLKDVSQITRLDWKTVKNIDKDYLKSLLPDISSIPITRIAIDEIAVMKGHKYLTIIRDYDTGIAIKIVFGRGYEETANALAKLGRERLDAIQFAVMDMWDPYIKAIKEQCQNVKIIFDKFHIIKKVNEALDKIRKKEFANAEPSERLNMKHRRFIILKKECNLDDSQRESLSKLMNNNDYMCKGYLLKEQVISIFDDKSSTFEQIQRRIFTWIENVLSNGIDEFLSVIGTFKNYMYGILNYFKYNMTNAIAEGFNTKINIIKRRAYGFTDIEYFILKIYQSSLRRLP